MLQLYPMNVQTNKSSLRKPFLSLFILILLSACEKEDDGLQYYCFQQSDAQWFTDYKKGDTVSFISENAPTRKYVVLGVADVRKQAWAPGFGGSPEFYYDRRDIKLCRIDNLWPSKSSGLYFINIYRFPNFSAAGEPLLATKESRFIITVGFDDYNVLDAPSSVTIRDTKFPDKYTTLTIQGEIYNEVVHIRSNNPDSYCSNCPNIDSKYDWELRVDQFYYHKQYGIIAFSDLDGVTWQIKRL